MLLTDHTMPAPTIDSTARDLYLDLMKKVLTRSVFGEHFQRIDFVRGDVRRTLYAPLKRLLDRRRLVLVKHNTVDPTIREQGRDWPADAETMVGMRRLDNIQYCVTDVLQRGVPGDLIETGVWRGGSVIFMRAILKAYADTHRRVWVADSFEGLPAPNAEKYPADASDKHHTFAQLAITLEQVRANFEKYGLLDEQVKFLKGWFKDTLAAAPAEHYAVVRLDGDMYESTMDALKPLYPKLSVGGYLIVDDYGVVPACKQAIEDYRREHGITEPIVDIDGYGVYWRKER